MPKARPFRYEWVDRVRLEPTLPAICFKVAHHIACRFNEKEGCAWPSVDDIGNNVAMSPRSVQRAIKELEKRGFLKIDRKGGRSKTNRYYLQVSDRPAKPQKDDIGAAKGRQYRPQNGDIPVCQHIEDTYKIDNTAAPEFDGITVNRKTFPQRGQHEIEIANRLGQHGWNILTALSEATLNKVCRLQELGRLSDLALLNLRQDVLAKGTKPEQVEQKEFERNHEQEIKP